MKRDFRSSENRKIGDSVNFQGAERAIEDIKVHDWQGQFYKLSGISHLVHYSCFEPEYVGRTTAFRKVNLNQ